MASGLSFRSPDHREYVRWECQRIVHVQSLRCADLPAPRPDPTGNAMGVFSSGSRPIASHNEFRDGQAHLGYSITRFGHRPVFAPRSDPFIII
jgi:hypothetical protein